MKYASMNRTELKSAFAALQKQYDETKKKGLSLDLSRGKPSGEQLDLLKGFLTCMDRDDCVAEGHDYRNYGFPTGIPEAKKLLSDLYEIPANQIIVGGNSSLNLMYDALARYLLYGTAESKTPWCREGKLKFLCPAPGYDRHFAVTESLGFELIPVKMTAEGPDMDEVEALVADPAVKGIWCNPKYSNPTGITFSDTVVRRLATMKTGAADFCIMWDNAYAVHAFDRENDDKLADILTIAKEAGNANRVLYFGSTSKITFPGAGIAFLAASEENVKYISSIMSVQTIGHDKLNQLRHVRYFGTADKVREHMRKQGDLLARRFARIEEILTAELGETGIASWTHPKGGYFVSFTTPDGCAKRVYELCRELGVTLTNVGATYPYGKDPYDNNIRIAPTYPTFDAMVEATYVLTLCTKLAAVEQLLK